MSNASRDMLQPSLLDRLADDSAGQVPLVESSLVISRDRLKKVVLRDLEWLLNARTPLNEAQTKVTSQSLSILQKSVLGYGMPALAGQTATTVDISVLERSVRDLILNYEPRISADTLKVKAVFHEVLMNRHNMVGLEITGHLWAKPYPIELLLRTQLDLETGHMSVKSN